MTYRNNMLFVPWHLKYPAKDRLASRVVGEASLPAKPVIVDIGGNQGIDLQRFADSFPDMDCELILQDLPETLKGISEPLDPRIHLTAYDFFTEQSIQSESPIL